MKLLKKIAWPLFALAAALALWITFVGSPELISTVPAMLAYESVPPDLEPSTDLPARLQLEVAGPSPRLRALAGSVLTAVVNLQAVREPGEHTIPINAHSVDLPAGVRLIRAVPSQIRVRFERRVQAKVPVKAHLGAPPSGYRVVAAEIHPGTLAIEGAQSRVEQVRNVETDPIDLADVLGKSQFRVRAYLDDPHVRFVSSPEVRVTVALEKGN